MLRLSHQAKDYHCSTKGIALSGIASGFESSSGSGSADQGQTKCQGQGQGQGLDLEEKISYIECRESCYS